MSDIRSNGNRQPADRNPPAAKSKGKRLLVYILVLAMLMVLLFYYNRPDRDFSKIMTIAVAPLFVFGCIPFLQMSVRVC